MVKAGSIVKIAVRNFVTYTDVEMEPGPNLNMIIGPNGTGKSTIVAAIILGLGGNPKTVGRGTKISEYVKHNHEEANIEITLQGHEANELITIGRRFDIRERSTWTLNHRKASFKEIEAAIKQFNIQVDNLCQFLPQDRVQDFTKMNKQQLLQQTQIAVCRTDLVEKQQDLIKMYEKHKDLQSSLEKYGQDLQELQDANIRIEGKVKNLTKKKKYLKKIEDVDRKLAWMNYENMRNKMDDIKADKAKAAELLHKYKEEAKPIESAINNAKKTISSIDQTITAKSRQARQNENLVQNKLDKHKELKSSITQVLGDLNSKLREIDQRNQDIADATAQIDELKRKRIQVLETYGDENQRSEKIKKLNDTLKNITKSMNNINEKKARVENERRNKVYEIRSFEEELKKLENIKQQRLEWLRRMDKDAYAAVQWLRANRHMFKGEVFEPMMLELNVLNPQHAMFVENTVPLRDKVAFTCVLKEDMNLLIKMLRDEQKLSVNIVHSGNEQPSLQTYQPAIPIEQLRKYGLFAYIRSLVTGPDPILKYLCKTYRIHNTPVGNNTTNDHFEEIPSQISNFFSNTYRFTTSFSRYTKQKSTRQMEIKSDGSLSISLNTERMECIRGQLIDVKNDCKKFDEELQSLDSQVTTYSEQQRSIREHLRETQKCKQEIDGIDSRIRVLTGKLQQLQQFSTTREELQHEYDKCIKDVVKKMVSLQCEIKKVFVQYSNSLDEAELDRTNLSTARKQVTFLENKSQDVRRLCQEAEQTLGRIKELLSNTTSDAKAALSKAKQLSNGSTPLEEGFKEFKEAYDNLSENIEELQAEKDHILSKIDCLNTAGLGELQAYEQRQDKIARLQVDIEEGNKQLNKVNTNMDKSRNEWLEPLRELVGEIDKKFSSAFKRMGCAGEVWIYSGENKMDFAEYGLSINVKYRDTQPLQELNSIVQSGGERAVATAAFMLSLQELTPVPFRCVDEINQGMDANNERRIFELLVETTSQSDTSQYFFITPKLVPNLKYDDTLTVHIVYNGPFVPTKEQWNLAEFSRGSG